jgi:hypothetical protein
MHDCDDCSSTGGSGRTRPFTVPTTAAMAEAFPGVSHRVVKTSRDLPSSSTRPSATNGKRNATVSSRNWKHAATYMPSSAVSTCSAIGKLWS